MVVVAQLVRAPDCGSGGRRFETGLPPKTPPKTEGFYYYDTRKFYLSVLLGKSI
tara:strand:+ start:280 stop:441 length:162 start_codon:yes stop_codon:yes gene_type:complete